MTDCRHCNHYDNNACTNRQSDCYGYAVMDYNGCAWGESDWISITDRLPSKDTEVIAYWRNNIQGKAYDNYEFAYYNGKHWMSYSACNLPVTHWQPRPQPPRD